MLKTILTISLIILSGITSVYAQDGLPDRYHRYTELIDSLALLQNLFPSILFMDKMGHSTCDNLPIVRMKISDNVRVDEDEPAVFFCAGVHADEVLGTEVAFNFIQDIVRRYADSDPEAVYFIEELEVFVVPVVNPEGRLVVEGGDLDWRKNKCDNNRNGIFDSYDGVDLNRNYDIGWEYLNGDNSDDPQNLMFRGYAPFSQTENQAMRDFAWKYRPVVAIDYHSPTYGWPEVAYFPWVWNYGGCGNSPDFYLFRQICGAYAQRIPQDDGSGYYSSFEGYVNKGDFKTFFYGNFGTVVFAVEISDTTIQNPALVDSIVAHHLPSQYFLLDRALGPGITGIIRDSVTNEPLEAEIRVLQNTNQDINPRLSRPDNGRYRRLLGYGNYDLMFLKEGYRTQRFFDVPVSNDAMTVVDIYLSPELPRPPAPELYFPVYGDIVSDPFIVFCWSHLDSILIYQLEISLNQQFTSIVFCDSGITVNEYEIAAPNPGGPYYWRVKAANENGWGPYSNVFAFAVELQSDIDFNGLLAKQFTLQQNQPNPFNNSTLFSFYLPRQSTVEIEVFDLSGALVAKPASGSFAVGWHSQSWNGVDPKGEKLASGVYLYRLKAGNFSETKKLLIIK